MGSERRSMPEQELSIRDREQELFVEVQDNSAPEPTVKPFPIYLRETPAYPISTEVKVILWIVGIAVLLLFGVALWRTQRPPRPLRTPAATKAAVLDVAPLPPTHCRPWKGQPAGLAHRLGTESGVIS
jgi:hypothetical protein